MKIPLDDWLIKEKIEEEEEKQDSIGYRSGKRK